MSSAEVPLAQVVSIRSINSTADLVAHEAGHWPRVFTTDGVHPFDQIEWKISDACIRNGKNNIVFEQKGVEVPAWWTQNNINVVADKYFRVVNGVRENSVKQMFLRVCSTIRTWANEQNFFNTNLDAQVFEEELLYALLHQYGAFNSPVWFNLGIEGRKQAASACFISGVDDSLDDIMRFQSSELTIFRGGSGSGANLSNVRSSYEKISAGSYTSGPMSWMQGNNAYAGAMKSGGATRNAAKMVIMDMDHPDILETRDGRPGFIRCKSHAEKLAHDLVSVGYSADYDNPNGAYKLVPYQNANHSVSVPDTFMQAMLDNGDWQTRERKSGKTVHNYNARDVWKEIADAAWSCGDPGVQFSDNINKWHTTPKNGRIRASNPCFAAETRIATEFGLITIADLYERVLDGEVKVAVHVGDGVSMRPATIFSTGMNPLLEVQFKSGRVITVTPNHNFLLRDGSKKPAADLMAGDSVDIQCAAGDFGSYDCGLPTQNEWFKIAGFVVGDGWMTKTIVDSKQHRDKGWQSKFDRTEVGMCFGKDDKDILAKVSSFLEASDIPFSLKRQKGSVGESPDYMRIRRAEIFKVMEDISCPAGSRSHTKRIQSAVFESSRVDQLAFLSGFISADGTFRVSKTDHNGNIPTRELRISSTSLGLLQDTQAILLNLGIKATIIQNRNGESRSGKFTYTSVSGEVRVYNSKHTLHELFVYGHSLRKLRDDMKEVGGLLSSRKQAQLDEFLPEGHSTPIHDIWNDEVVSVIDTGREELTYNMTEITTHTIIASGIKIFQCSEFLHVDNTACNLCAINLTKFFDGREFMPERFTQATRLFSTSQMAIVAKAAYPTDEIGSNSHKLRPIGTNYGDLGALIMNLGHGYDSDEGRAIAARMASLMTGIVYLTSAKLAARIGAFSEFEKNREDMLRVIRMHQEADSKIIDRWHLTEDPINDGIVSMSAEVWKETLALGEKFGYNVSQATLQAPLGTISFLMGMNTTGIEPAFSLVSYKSLVGGGVMKLINFGIREALENLGYSSDEVEEICKYIELNDTIENAPGLKDEHLHVFDTAMPSGPSGRYLSPMAHIKMMAAIQPLITCAMSKTVNLPESITSGEIAKIYEESWRLGLKCIALYRDKCKASQPLVTKETKDSQSQTVLDTAEVVQKMTREVSPSLSVVRREKMPYDVKSWRHKFEIDGYKGYLIVSEYPNGRPGEIFMKLGKPGSTISGLMDGFTQLCSIAIQYGIPLPRLISSFIDTRFEPHGITSNKKIRIARSLYDYMFKVLDLHYYGGANSGLADRVSMTDELDEKINEGITKDNGQSTLPPSIEEVYVPKKSLGGPPCSNCGDITQRNGSCYLCTACGTTTGCS